MPSTDLPNYMLKRINEASVSTFNPAITDVLLWCVCVCVCVCVCILQGPYQMFGVLADVALLSEYIYTYMYMIIYK